MCERVLNREGKSFSLSFHMFSLFFDFFFQIKFILKRVLHQIERRNKKEEIKIKRISSKEKILPSQIHSQNSYSKIISFIILLFKFCKKYQLINVKNKIRSLRQFGFKNQPREEKTYPS